MDRNKTQALEAAMQTALEAARRYEGATAPNPPVGCAALDSNLRLLGVAAHQKAGSPHAERLLLEQLKNQTHLIHTLVVTLEPCCHQGKTPPCIPALLELPELKTVVVGTHDPNPKVKGRGIELLKNAGIEVLEGVLEKPCRELIKTFICSVLQKRPWIIVKTAFRANGSMIPEPGQKTFTSLESLKLAHEMRKRADAILTGSGTVIADQPLFTIRQGVEDFVGKKRWLIVLDRRQRVQTQMPEWMEEAKNRGFEVRTDLDFFEALRFLGEQGALEVLIEAGPTLTKYLQSHQLWDSWVTIRQNPSANTDQIETKENPRTPEDFLIKEAANL